MKKSDERLILFAQATVIMIEKNDWEEVQETL